MKIVVASGNPAKLAAARETFGRLFPDASRDLHAVRAESGVSDQPVGDDETLTGARNRVHDARQQVPDADFWVGFEGGIVNAGDGLLAFAWAVVADRNGHGGEARSATLPLPKAVRELVGNGVELGEANDRVFGVTDSKRQGGAFGLLTGGRLTRESVYADTLLLAMVPLCHPLFQAGADADWDPAYR